MTFAGSTLGRDLGSRLRALRPRWAWICLAISLPWLLTPLSCDSGGGAGCLAVPMALCFWLALSVLGPLALRWFWRKLLFKVSRRLWVILLLTALAPVLTLAVFFLSLGWLGMGAQKAQLVRDNLNHHQRALQEAGRDPSDPAVVQALRVLGRAAVTRPRELPPGVKADFLGLAYEPGQGLSLRLVQSTPTGLRLITLTLDPADPSQHDLWSGRAEFRLDRSDALNLNSKRERRTLQLEGKAQLTGVPPLEAWTQGDLPTGTGLLQPFPLPAVVLRAVDWSTGHPLSLTLTPVTSLKELFAGYGFNQGNRSAQAFLAIVALTSLILFLSGIQMVALLMGLALARNLGKAVDGLFKGVARLSGGDFGARIQTRGSDQIAHLANAFNGMAEHLQRAEDEHGERLRLEEELKVAREVQMRLLPDVRSLSASVQAAVLPAREVAGDYFDVIKLADGRLAFLIADVSGKGTSAAFYAAETKGVLAALDKQGLDAREVATRINAIWCASHPRSLFMTMIYGTFNPETGDFSLVRAGHPAPLLARANGQVERLNPRGLGIGMSARAFAAGMDICTGTLEPGDRLVCYTDGLSEARDPDGELFGEARLTTLLTLPCADPKPIILGAVADFLRSEPLDDDLTLLILQR